jgi:hypothetical protein
MSLECSMVDVFSVQDEAIQKFDLAQTNPVVRD